MCRYFIIFLCSIMYGAYASAAVKGKICTYSIDTNTVFFADLALAPIGSAVAELQITVKVSRCDTASGYEVMVTLAPQSPYAAAIQCETNIKGIVLDPQLAGTKCRGDVSGKSGPFIGSVIVPVDKPITLSKAFTFTKSGVVAPGLHALRLSSPGFTEVLKRPGGIVGEYDITGYAFPPGEIVGTTCVLVNPDVSVDFGKVSSIGIQQPFAIEFGSCSGQKDAAAYNAAVSLWFKAERINADGTALRNNQCVGCAAGLQIAIKDGAGKSVDLSSPYRLSSNGSVDIGNSGLVYNFVAELQGASDEAISPGVIDAQLVFETIIE